MFILISACYLDIFAFEEVIELLQFNYGPCISQDSFGISILFSCFFDSQSLGKGGRSCPTVDGGVGNVEEECLLTPGGH